MITPKEKPLKGGLGDICNCALESSALIYGFNLLGITMKPLLIATLVLSLTGCGIDRQRLIDAGNLTMQQQAAAAQWRMQSQQYAPNYNPNTPTKTTDWQCVNSCNASGYQYGLCLSKCSY